MYRGRVVGRRVHSGLPALSKQRTRRCRNFTSPNTTRLIRLAKLLMASVCPVLTWERCQATICVPQRLIVRPNRCTSEGNSRSVKSNPIAQDHSPGPSQRRLTEFSAERHDHSHPGTRTDCPSLGVHAVEAEMTRREGPRSLAPSTNRPNAPKERFRATYLPRYRAAGT